MGAPPSYKTQRSKIPGHNHGGNLIFFIIHRYVLTAFSKQCKEWSATFSPTTEFRHAKKDTSRLCGLFDNVFDDFSRGSEPQSLRQVPMNVVGIPDRGLALIAATDPRFEAMVRGLIGKESTPELDALEAFSVILTNDNAYAVAAYSLRWEYTNASGKRVHVDLSDGQITRLLDGPQRKNTIEFDKSGPTIAPYSWVIATPPTVLKNAMGAARRANDPDYQALLRKIALRLGGGQDLSITLDGAFFEDGSFIGPNRTHLFENFKTEVIAKQNLVSQIIDASTALDKQSIDDIARGIQTSLPDSRPKLVLSPDGSIIGTEEYYRYKYASQFLSVYHNSGSDDALRWAQYHLFQNYPKLVKLNSNDGLQP